MRPAPTEQRATEQLLLPGTEAALAVAPISTAPDSWLSGAEAIECPSSLPADTLVIGSLVGTRWPEDNLGPFYRRPSDTEACVLRIRTLDDAPATAEFALGVLQQFGIRTAWLTIYLLSRALKAAAGQVFRVVPCQLHGVLGLDARHDLNMAEKDTVIEDELYRLRHITVQLQTLRTQGTRLRGEEITSRAWEIAEHDVVEAELPIVGARTQRTRSFLVRPGLWAQQDNSASSPLAVLSRQMLDSVLSGKRALDALIALVVVARAREAGQGSGVRITARELLQLALMKEPVKANARSRMRCRIEEAWESVQNWGCELLTEGGARCSPGAWRSQPDGQQRSSRNSWTAFLDSGPWIRLPPALRCLPAPAGRQDEMPTSGPGLSALRRSRNLTQTHLAKLLECSPSLVSKAETGKARLDMDRLVSALVRHQGLSASYPST